MPWLPKQPNRLRSEQADPVLPHSHDSRSVTSERHLWIAHLSISATKTTPKFKLSTQLQLLKNVHFIENHLIYWSPTLWWQTSWYSCNPAAIAYVLVSWQLTAPRCLQTCQHYRWRRSYFRLALHIHGLNPTSDANVAGGRAAGERCYQCDDGNSDHNEY